MISHCQCLLFFGKLLTQLDMQTISFGSNIKIILMIKYTLATHPNFINLFRYQSQRGNLFRTMDLYTWICLVVSLIAMGAMFFVIGRCLVSTIYGRYALNLVTVISTVQQMKNNKTHTHTNILCIYIINRRIVLNQTKKMH